MLGDDLVAQIAHGTGPLELALSEDGLGQVLAILFGDDIHDRMHLNLWSNVLGLLIATGRSGQFVHGATDLADGIMPEADRLEEELLRDLRSVPLDHSDGVRGTCDDDINLSLSNLLNCGVKDELAIHTTHTNSANGAEKRNVGQVQRGEGRVHGDNVWVILEVVLNDKGANLHLIVVRGREQGTDGTINHPARQDFFRGGTSLTLHKATGELARGLVLLTVIHAQREEVNPWAGVCGANRCEHRSVAIGTDHRSRCLLGKVTGLKLKGTAPQFYFHCRCFHFASFPLTTAHAAGFRVA